MLRYVYDHDGMRICDMAVGVTDVRVGNGVDDFESVETAFVFDGAGLEEFRDDNEVVTCVKNRPVIAVTR
jgi:hypothetical protein